MWLMGSPVYAQTEVGLDPELGGRLSFTLDKKLVRRLHLELEEEIRMVDNFSSFGRFHTSLGVTYKLNDYLKLGLGYAMINPYDSDNSTFKSSRHRLMFDATGMVRFGDWRLSLKERFQATYRSGDMNEYQNPRTALTLKSRLKLSYKGFRRIEPYAYLELRNTLNAPVIRAVYNTATDTWGYYDDGIFYIKGDAGWFIDGWSGAYLNRIRGSLGFDYRLSRASSLDVAILLDRVTDKVLDANSDGTKLKSYTYEKGFKGWITVGYTYSIK